jgi:protein-tyrosine phosphatase
MAPESDTEYLRFNWLVPGKIAGAPHPELCDGLASVAAFLHEQGVGSIVTLHEKPIDPPPQEFGFQYLFVETADFQPPANLPRILDFINAELEEGRGVLVHCFAGIGRTGTVLAAWLLQQDATLSAIDAITRVRDEYIPDYARTRFPESAEQEEALEKFARRGGFPGGVSPY